MRGATSTISRRACSASATEVAEWYVTFHHKGVIEGREQFVELVDAFTAVIDRRHGAMLDFLGEPHSIDDMVEHRFIYRPHVESAFVRSVERRSADLHVQRMLRRGEAVDGRLGTVSDACDTVGR